MTDADVAAQLRVLNAAVTRIEAALKLQVTYVEEIRRDFDGWAQDIYGVLSQMDSTVEIVEVPT